MQFGIIANAPITEGNKETIQMGLIDYKNPPADSVPAVIISWTRAKGKEYSRPSIVSVATDLEGMGATGSILKALSQKKMIENIHDPASLLHILQKQLGRHVVFDPRQKKFVMTKSLKETDIQWEAIDDNGHAFCTVESEDESSAKAKVIRKMSEKAAGDHDASMRLAAWLAAQKIERLVGVDGKPPEFAELTVYSRRSAKK